MLYLRGCPGVQRSRANDADVDTKLAMNSTAADAKEAAQVRACPPRRRAVTIRAPFVLRQLLHAQENGLMLRVQRRIFPVRGHRERSKVPRSLFRKR
jgi:hypothetical protein